MSTNRMGSPLGKGLKALLPATLIESSQGDGIASGAEKGYFLCPIDFIAPNPDQPRKEVQDRNIEELSASIKEKGVLQPLVVRKLAENKYELIAGERRMRAAKMAGLEKVPVVLRDVALADRLELALIENIQREDLNAIEEAEAYGRLRDEFSLTQDVIAKRVGKDRSTVANALRLLLLPDDIKQDLATGALTAGHARVLLSFVDDPVALRELRQAITRDGLSVRETEALGKSRKGGGQGKPRTQKAAPPPPGNMIPESYCASLTSILTAYLGSKCRIVQGQGRGKIEIEYYSLDDLERILELVISEKTA